MKILKNNFLFVTFLILSIVLVSCEEDQTSDNSLVNYNYISLEEPLSKLVSLYIDETTTIVSKVYATQESDVDRTYNLVVDSATTLDASYYSVPATVTIPAGEKVGTYSVGITGTNIGSGKKLIVRLEQQEGVDVVINDFTETSVVQPGSSTPRTYVDVVKSAAMTFDIEERCDFNKCVLTIKFDNYPEETAWELYNMDDPSNPVLVTSGGLDAAGTAITGYAALGFADQSTFSTNICLQDGTYSFVIYDDYGDGMYTSASVQGNYSLKLGSTILASGSGNFGTFQETTFTLP